MARQLLSVTREEARWERLREYLQRARTESPFYAEVFAQLDVDALPLPEGLARLPFTTREQLSSGDPFRFVFSGRKEIQAYYESSGTTGEPVPALPALGWDKCRAFGEYLDRWMRLGEHRVKRAAVALPYELSPAGIRLQLALSSIGVTVIPVGVRSVFCPPARQLDVIARLRPEAIFGRPLELLRLADAFNAAGTRPRDLDVTKLFFTGEMVSHAKWRRLAEEWDDAEVFGQYGLSELDAGLQSCEARRYHEADGVTSIFEVVEPGGASAVPDGHPGELVVTALRDDAMPLFRYRSGDQAIRHTDRCVCGVPTASYTIVGRLADARVVEGRVVFPRDVEEVLYADDDVGNEYQLLWAEGTPVRVRLERRHGSNRELTGIAARVEAALRARGISASVTVADFGAIFDKLGIAKHKAGRFHDVAPQDAPPETNCVDREALEDVWSPPTRGTPS